MSPDWSTPATWQVDQLVTDADLNSQLRDNLAFLKDPPTAARWLDADSDYRSVSDDFVDVDSANLALELETAGGDVMVGFIGTLRAGDNRSAVSLDVAVDGRRLAGAGGLFSSEVSLTKWFPASFVILARAIAAGTHTFRLQWRRTARHGAVEMIAGAGREHHDTHGQFWAREVS